MRTLILFLNIGFLVAVLMAPLALWADAAPISAPQGPLLDNLLQEALDNNQGLAAMEQNVAALREQIPVAGTWEDPKISFGLLNVPTDTFSFDQEAMTQKQITLAQRIPWFGKQDLKSRLATLGVMRLSSALAAKRHQLAKDLADAFYELGFVAASEAINDRMMAYLDQLSGVAETRYGAGKGLQQDVLQAQVEQSRLRDERHALQRQRRTLEDRINSLLNRQERVSITPPVPADLPALKTAVAAWQDNAMAHNPELHSLRIGIEQASVQIELARKDYYPDPDIMLAYGQRDDDPAGRDRADFFSASVAFTLPVWAKTKQDRRLEAAIRQRDAARAQYQDLAAQLPHRIDAMAAELEQLKASYNLYKETILIQADQWAESARFSYEVGKTDFSTMLSARLRLLILERQSQQYLFQFYRKMAALNEIMGGQLMRPAALASSRD